MLELIYEHTLRNLDASEFRKILIFYSCQEIDMKILLCKL